MRRRWFLQTLSGCWLRQDVLRKKTGTISRYLYFAKSSGTWEKGLGEFHYGARARFVWATKLVTPQLLVGALLSEAVKSW